MEEAARKRKVPDDDPIKRAQAIAAEINRKMGCASAPSSTPTATMSVHETDEVQRVLKAADHFAVLQLDRGYVEPADARRQYRRIALKVHPDKSSHPQAEEAFKVLSTAYDCLEDAATQAAYLREISEPHKRFDINRKRPAAKKQPQKSWWHKRSWADIERELRRREEVEAALRASFVARQKEQYATKKVSKTLLKCQKICEELDLPLGVPRHSFWPPEDDDEDDLPRPVPPQLDDVLSYLREVHLYCVFCVSKFESESEMRRCCPGPQEDDHDDDDQPLD